MNFTELKTREIIQAGDSFLFKAFCPQCKSLELYDISDTRCISCGVFFENIVFDLENFRSKHRLICGTERKSKQGIGKKVIRKLLESYGSACYYCNKDVDIYSIHIDHIIPICVGGSNNIHNLAISCPTCNLIAGAKVFKTIDDKKTYISVKRKLVTEAHKITPEAKNVSLPF